MSARIIWKFTLDAWRPDTEMPKGTRILHVHEQGGNVCVWAECDPAAPIVLRRMVIVGTGHAVPPFATTYVGTAHLVDQGLALHVFDGGEVGE